MVETRTRALLLQGYRVRLTYRKDFISDLSSMASTIRAHSTKAKLLAGTTSLSFDQLATRPRAKPASAQAEPGNVKLVRRSWNDTFLEEVCSFQMRNMTIRWTPSPMLSTSFTLQNL